MHTILAMPHTNDDTVVYFPDLKIAMISDTVYDTNPVVDWANGGSVVGWKSSLDAILKPRFRNRDSRPWRASRQSGSRCVQDEDRHRDRPRKRPQSRRALRKKPSWLRSKPTTSAGLSIRRFSTAFMMS